MGIRHRAIKLDGIENPIIDARTPAEKLSHAIAGERELVILYSASGQREFIQTGPNAAPLMRVIESGQVQLVRSKSLDGPYYLGLFDAQERLRILVKGARQLPKSQLPYKLMIGDKLVVNEFIEKVLPVYGKAAAVCYCTTT